MLVLLLAAQALGQEPAQVPAGDTARAPVARETTPIPQTGLGHVPQPRKSPGTAVLLSFLIPGGGQVYTRRYAEACLIAPAEVALGCLSVRDHQAATRALAGGDTTGYVRLRDRRNALLWWTGAVVAFSMADAYVSAQMFGFDRQMGFALGPLRAGLVISI